MDGIIPAAGIASRMRGIPKFLLPCDEVYTTLIEAHILNLSKICETIWIPTRPELIILLESLGIAKDRIVVLPMQTENMTQTVQRVVKISKADYFQLVMPDTYFYGEQPYFTLNQKPALAELACWKIRKDQKGKLGQVKIEGDVVHDLQDKDPNCSYEYAWGSLSFQAELMSYANQSDPHIGYAVKNALISGNFISAKKIIGKYFDCGTPKEYLSMLDEVLKN